MRNYVYLTLALLLLTALAFYSFPALDLTIADWFENSSAQFWVKDTWWGRWGRTIFADVPFVVLGWAALAYIGKKRGWAVHFAPSGKQLAFLVLSMVLSTGVLVNLVMKDHLHRPRPAQVSALGGNWAYKQFYQFDGECPRNCSFPSGEASASFWLVGAAAELTPAPYKAEAVGAALIFGALTGLLRMAFGGHFLSDVLFAGLLTLLVCFGTHRLIFGRKAA